MSELSPQEQKLRELLKAVSRIHVAMWRLGLGPFLGLKPDWWSQIMIVTHTGRKTGLKRRTALNYALVEGEIYFLAGFGMGSDWYRNVLKEPRVDVWLPNGWWSGLVEDVSESRQRLRIMREIVIASAFVGKLAGLDANAMSDEELDRMTSDYRLLHLQRTEACTGSGGPGDLAWVWPLATAILLPLVLLKRGSRPGAPSGI